MIEILKIKSTTYAIIIRSNAIANKSSFLTKHKDEQQIGLLVLKKNLIINPHYHKKTKRIIENTSEILIIKKGKLRIDLYDVKFNYFKSSILKKNDVILILHGSHGFKILEDSVVIECKQGPFIDNKTNINFIEEKNINL